MDVIFITKLAICPHYNNSTAHKIGVGTCKTLPFVLAYCWLCNAHVTWLSLSSWFQSGGTWERGYQGGGCMAWEWKIWCWNASSMVDIHGLDKYIHSWVEYIHSVITKSISVRSLRLLHGHLSPMPCSLVYTLVVPHRSKSLQLHLSPSLVYTLLVPHRSESLQLHLPPGLVYTHCSFHIEVNHYSFTYLPA